MNQILGTSHRIPHVPQREPQKTCNQYPVLNLPHSSSVPKNNLEYLQSYPKLHQLQQTSRAVLKAGACYSYRYALIFFFN